MRIKVAFLEEDAAIGGAEINVLNLIENLDKEKIQTLVICPFEGPFSKRVRQIEGKVVIVKRFPVFSTSGFIFGKKLSNPFAVIANLFFFFPSALKISKFLKQESIDILHTNSMLAHFYGAIACRLARVKCLWHVQDIVDPKQAFGIFLKVLNKSGKWLPNRIVVISNAVKGMFDKDTLRKVSVVYNGIDLNKFSKANSREKIRKDFAVSMTDPFVCTIGRIVHWKGHRVFLSAARQTLRKLPKTKFLIVGDTSFGKNEYLVELKKMLRELNIAQSVIFSDFRKDIPQLLSAIDILVHPSTLPEPFGLSIIEAMAAGKPVIASKGGGIPEIVVDGLTGKLVPMGDAEALSDAITQLIQKPELRNAFGREGKKRVEQFFSNETFVKKMSREYMNLAFNNY